jgi:DNA-binding HxlR family transcriptional regulator
VSGETVGVRAFSILEKPLNVAILRAHSGGPTRLFELQQAVDWVAATTLRTAVASICDVGALVRRGSGETGRRAVTCLTPAGRELLEVGDVVAAWLALCPLGPVAPDRERARLALKALAGGWDTKLIRIVAEAPASHRELSRCLPGVSYPALQRRLAWMRRSGQLERFERPGREAAFQATRWLRLAVAPLSMSARWELRRLGGDGAELSEAEVESAFLLTLPLVRSQEAPDLSCTLAVTLPGTASDRRRLRLAGVTAELVGGRVRSCRPVVGAAPGNWAIGTPEAWFEAVIEGRIERLRFGGEQALACAELVAAIHCLLFEPG